MNTQYVVYSYIYALPDHAQPLLINVQVQHFYNGIFSVKSSYHTYTVTDNRSADGSDGMDLLSEVYLNTPLESPEDRIYSDDLHCYESHDPVTFDPTTLPISMPFNSIL